MSACVDAVQFRHAPAAVVLLAYVYVVWGPCAQRCYHLRGVRGFQSATPGTSIPSGTLYTQANIHAHARFLHRHHTSFPSQHLATLTRTRGPIRVLKLMPKVAPGVADPETCHSAKIAAGTAVCRTCLVALPDESSASSAIAANNGF
jgi:hypothetical protein